MNRPVESAPGANRPRIALIAGVGVVSALLVLATAMWFWFGSPDARDPEGNRPVRLGLALQAPSALLFVAAEEGFFADEGLDVTTRYYDSGYEVLGELLTGEVDAAGVSATPLVIAGFERSDFAIVATIASLRDDPRIVARRDHGIESPADLRGKRVATQHGSSVHFFLDWFLIHHGLSVDDVTLLFMDPDELVAALADGQIDSFSMREPFVSQAVEELGEQAVVFRDAGLDLRAEHLVVSETLLEQHPGAVDRLLRALIRAERFVHRRPERARQIVSEALGMSDAALQAQWNPLELEVHLDQWLLSSMEEQARWAIRAELVEAETMPNYLDLLSVEPLEALKPEAVTVIR